MNAKKGFIVPLVIVIIAILAIGGGIYIYTKNKSTSTSVSTNTQASSTNQIAGSKTYANSKYGFQFTYPQEFLPDEQDDTVFGMVLQSKSSSGFINILFGKNNNVKITDAIHPATSQSEVVSNKGTETINGNLWSKFNFDSIPQEGRGTAGSQLTYYIVKGDSTLVLQCTDCSEETFGDMASSTRVAFNQILSTFKFNTIAQSSNSDWKAYTNSQYGFQVSYPADWVVMPNPNNGTAINSPFYFSPEGKYYTSTGEISDAKWVVDVFPKEITNTIRAGAKEFVSGNYKYDVYDEGLQSTKFSTFLNSFKVIPTVSNNQGTEWSTYDKYNFSIVYPTHLIVKEEGASAASLTVNTVDFYETNSLKPTLNVNVYNNGNLHLGTRDWKDLTIANNKFMISCDSSSNMCEIIPQTASNTTLKYEYLINSANPNTDQIVRDMLASFTAK